MSLSNIKSIKMSLLKKTILHSEEFPEYTKEITGNMKLNEVFDRTEDNFKEMLSKMLESLTQQNKKKVDTVAIWVDEGDSVIKEGAIDLSVLSDILEYSIDKTAVPIFEFFKMVVFRENITEVPS